MLTKAPDEQMQVSVILPVMDETAALHKTVEILLAENREYISEILIIVCDRTSAEAIAACEELLAAIPEIVRLRKQKRPFLGGAMQDAFEWASGTHVLMMASDLETDPATVKELIAKAREGYDVVTATRWSKAGGFEGYSRLKYVSNWIFQRSFRALYGSSLSDLTYGFRIFKVEWVKNIAWEELRHAFLLETILKPLRLGARTAEIPTTWRTRREGTSHNVFWHNFIYFRTAVRTRFRSRQDLLVRSA